MGALKVGIGVLVVIGGYIAASMFLSGLTLLIALIIVAAIGGIIAAKKSFGGTVILAILLVIALLVLDKYYLHALPTAIISNYETTSNAINIFPDLMPYVEEYLTSLPEFAQTLVTLIVRTYPVLVIGSIVGGIGGYIGEKIFGEEISGEEADRFFEEE